MILSTNTFTRCAWLLLVGLVSACGSGNDTNSPISTQVTVAADASSNDSSANGSSLQTPETESGSDTSVVQDTSGNSGEDSTETNPQNDSQQANTDSQPDSQPDSQQQQTNPEASGTDSEQAIANNQRVNFGSAKLLVDLVSNGGSYPAKFHRTGDKLYFWTVDTDPIFARCLPHWGNLSDSDKSVSFSLVAADPETGVVAMNREVMTLGDFADDPNNACAGYNGSIMDVFEQIWISESSTAEQQFALHFDRFSLGPDLVWTTDASAANTNLTETGQDYEQTYIEGNKVFFANDDGLWVSDTLSGDRRRLFEPVNRWFSSGNIKRIVRSSERQATFEIRVGANRYQIWMYDLDTDEWAKKISIKPDDNIYQHNETLLVDGQTLLSRGENVTEGNSTLALSSTFGDVTSFEISSVSEPSIYRFDADSIDRLAFSTTDYSADPRTTSIWKYSEGRIDKLFSMSESGLDNRRVITGRDGRIYIAGTRDLQQWPSYDMSLELWSYHQQSGQLVKLSNDDWYAVITDHPAYDINYTFRYLNTPDGLIFVNLKKNSGRELWFTDGTSAGTRQLTDINPGAGNSDPQDFYYSGDAIYFSANDGTHDREPWMIPVSRQ